jgi:iron(III) transport system ATP-binding protein
VAEFMGETDFIVGEVVEGGVETPLGFYPYAAAVPIGTAVEIAARPDDIKILAVEEGDGDEVLVENGRIIDRRFLGIAYIYKVALSDGTLVNSWQPHTVNLPAGTAVSVSFRSHHNLVFFPKSKKPSEEGLLQTGT